MADDLLRIAAQVSDAALDGGHDVAEVEQRIGDIADYLLNVQSHWSANASKYASWKLVRPATYLGKADVETAVRAALDARGSSETTGTLKQLPPGQAALARTSLALGIACLPMLIYTHMPRLIWLCGAVDLPEAETEPIELTMEDLCDRLSSAFVAFSVTLAASVAYPALLRFAVSRTARASPESVISGLVIYRWLDDLPEAETEPTEAAEKDLIDWFLSFFPFFIVVSVAAPVAVELKDLSARLSSLLRWQLFGSLEITVPADWDGPRPWTYHVFRLPDGSSLSAVPPCVGPGQKFTYIAPPPPPVRRSWWFFGSPPPPPVATKPATTPTKSEPPPAAALPRVKTPKQQAAVALKRARQKDRKRRLTKGPNPSPPCSPVDSPPSEPTPAERMKGMRVMPSLGAALGR